jgi:hypothetical protein
VACPGVRREVETVYNSILYNLEADPDLCMTDIAVMVSDMSRYKPVVDSVFSRRPTGVTYNLVDSSARTESVFAQAVLAFMVLSRGNFSRKQVFDLLRNPCVMQRWEYGPEALSIWIGWADALGIFHGYENQAARAEDNPSGGLFSWRQGLERLRISRIMTRRMPSPVFPRPFQRSRAICRHQHGRRPASGKILRDCGITAWGRRRSHDGIGIGAVWRDAFFRVVDQFIEISADMRGEETVFNPWCMHLTISCATMHWHRIQPGRAADGRCAVGFCAVPSGGDHRRAG